MAHTFEYAVLTAIPNQRRGERVNVGVVVFKDETVDVRFKQAAYKLRALTGESWDTRLETATAYLETIFAEQRKPADVLAEFNVLEPLLVASKLGWLRATDEADYEQRVVEIINSLVGIPRKERPERQTRINTEIAREFRNLKILAKAPEGLDTGKVVRDYEIDESESLRADFALQNGKLHIASTLDLRKKDANLGEAALKSIVLDQAGKRFAGQIRKIGVYAVDEDMRDSFASHINMLGNYADDLYNWGDREGRWQFQKAIYDAIGHHGGQII